VIYSYENSSKEEILFYAKKKSLTKNLKYTLSRSSVFKKVLLRQ
jgi:hypothetical protein